MTPRQIREKAQNNWQFWRLILDGNISYSDAMQMDIEEIMEANAALDLYVEKLKKQTQKGKKGGAG
jgi:hypothetical protein